MTKRVYGGVLNIIEKDNGNFEYGLRSKTKAGLRNYKINYLLDMFYKNDARVEIILLHDKEKIFDSIGKLYREKQYGNYEWFVDDDLKGTCCLGDCLFENVDREVIFILEYEYFKIEK